MMINTLPTLAFDDWQNLPQHDTVLLSVNARLQRALERDWLADRSTGEAPRIYTPGLWLEDAVRPLLFRGRVAAPGRLLSAFEETWLREQLITAVEAEDTLLDPADAARLAREAHGIEQEWPQAIPAIEHTAEYLRYRTWQAQFEQHCQRERLLDGARWQHWLRQQILAHAETWPRHLVLAGIDELSLAWLTFLQQLADKGVRLYRLTRRQRVPQREKRIYADSGSEMRAAVQWAAEHSSRGRRVALVLPDLAARRAPLCRALDAVLHPESADPLLYESPRRYNVSLGEPLAQQAPIRAALAALHLLLARDGWSLPDTTPWLLAPFFGDGGDLFAHALRDAAWRRRGEHQLGWHWLQQQDWAQAWSTARAQLLTTRKAPASTWAERFSHALLSLQWPGARQLSSHEYQMISAWQEQLAGFARLDEVCGPLDAQAALRLLTRALREHVFQAESAAAAPIQVLGLLETAGGDFDALWVLGLTDEQLPARPQPNALLPAPWQRRLQTPHSSSAREAAFARQLLADMETCAPLLIASHPRFDGETELRGSPLLADWPLREATGEVPYTILPPEFDYVEDSIGLPLPAERRVPGGARVLELQARHAQWAYAECRLGAAPLENWAPFPDARLRGTLTHATLEACWQGLAGQDDLLALGPEQEQQHVVRAIHTGFAAETEALRGSGARWQLLEQNRLRRLLLRWLDKEKQRATPFRVAGLEVERPWQHGTLQLKLRIDRMDRVLGGLLLIDYKTGKVSTSGWGRADASDKPLIDVQLPLYATVLAEEDSVVGTAFACLAPGNKDFGFRATLLAPDMLTRPRTAPTEADYEAAQLAWEDTLAFWRASLQRLADEFCAGLATHRERVPGALRYCRIRPFLRELDDNDPTTDSSEDDDAPAL